MSIFKQHGNNFSQHYFFRKIRSEQPTNNKPSQIITIWGNSFRWLHFSLLEYFSATFRDSPSQAREKTSIEMQNTPLLPMMVGMQRQHSEARESEWNTTTSESPVCFCSNIVKFLHWRVKVIVIATTYHPGNTCRDIATCKLSRAAGTVWLLGGFECMVYVQLPQSTGTA